MSEQEPKECCKKNFFESLADTAKRVIQDPRPVSEAVKAERLAICDVCEHRKGDRCGLCGCYLPLKTKMNNVVCPDKPPRWVEHYDTKTSGT